MASICVTIGANFVHSYTPGAMYDLLRDHIAKRIELSDKEFSLAATFFAPKKLRKRQYLHQEGDVARWIAFTSKGCLRCYSVDDAGTEHVVQFAVEDWWIADLQSFLAGTPSHFAIDALEDSELLLLDRAKREDLLKAIPKFERFFRLILERNYVATNERIACTLMASAEDRYLAFLKSYPQFAQRVPQNQIASYLGIAPESLSRIRKDLSDKR